MKDLNVTKKMKILHDFKKGEFDKNSQYVEND